MIKVKVEEEGEGEEEDEQTGWVVGVVEVEEVPWKGLD